ncbi:TonB-dependent siderophore myxochelin receptor MxcH [Myxococcaceae bacterium GXIMD 01537]
MRTIFIFDFKGKVMSRHTVRSLCAPAVLAGLLASGVSVAGEPPPAGAEGTLERAAPPQEASPAPVPAVEMPRLVGFVEATYPVEAERERREAKVLLRLTLDAQGAVTAVDVMEPAGHGFDEAASEAARAFRFEPAKRNGTPVPSRISYSYEFRLPPGETAPPARPEAPAPAPAVATPAPAVPSAPVAAPSPVPPPLAGAEEAIEVTVEGDSEAERRRQSAEAVQVVETDHLQREAVDLGRALARTEGVSVQRAGGLGSRTRFSLGGLSDEQIRFFVDGVPLDLAGFGPSLGNVPVNLVQHVEIYQGVVPSRFGADALGGAVQIVTDQEIQGSGLAASYEFGSFDTHRLTASARYLHEPSGLLVRAHGFFDDARNNYPVDVEVVDSVGRISPARLPRFHDGFRAGGASVEAGFVERPWARRLMLRVFAGSFDKELQHAATMDNAFGQVGSAEDSGGATLRFEHAYAQGLSVNAVAGYTYRRTSFSDLSKCAYDWYGQCAYEGPHPGEIEARAIERYVNQHTGFARLNFAWSVAPQHTLRLALAPTYVFRTGEDKWLRANGDPDPLQADRNLGSLISGLEYEVDALDDRLENIAFVKDYAQWARTDKLLPSQKFVPLRQDTHEFGVGDSLRYRLTPALFAKASYEWATRLPRPDEFFGDGLLIDSNLDLLPEVSHNLNLGLSLDQKETPVGALRATVASFGRLADQLIVLIGRENYFTYQNVFSARSLGFTAAAGWTSSTGLLTVDGNVTWQDLRNVSSEGDFGTFEGQRIPNRPHLMANGSARLQFDSLLRAQDEVSLSWHAGYVHSFFRSWEGLGLKESKMRIPSQFVHSAALTYVLREATTTMSWTLDVQNFTDARAFDFYGIQRPGRSFFAKFTLER